MIVEKTIKNEGIIYFLSSFDIKLVEIHEIKIAIKPVLLMIPNTFKAKHRGVIKRAVNLNGKKYEQIYNMVITKTIDRLIPKIKYSFNDNKMIFTVKFIEIISFISSLDSVTKL